MNVTTVGIDLAKNVFSVHGVDAHGKVALKKTVSRGRLLELFAKRGDRYLRMLLTHGARAVLRSAVVAKQAGRQVDGLKEWALKVQGRTNHNKAACALANKLARICYAVLRDHEPYGKLSVREEDRKTNRTAYAVAG